MTLRLKANENEMPKRTCKIQIEEENMKVILSREDAHRRPKWFIGVNQMATRFRLIRPSSLAWDITGY